MSYASGNGEIVSLGSKLFAGGEGAVYEVRGKKDLVAKLYHKPITPHKAAKLSAMAGMCSPAIAQFAAWPTTTLHQGKDRTACGFLMPRIVDARPVHELESPAHRRAHFPHADWRFLIRAARNCAAAMTVLHQSGIVVGDINQGGFLITRDALVRVIDCDSFQIRTANDLYLCGVALPEFLPPELHGKDLDNTTRTTNHDAFGLAIIIFRLLMMGRHPFTGYRGAGDKPIPEAVKEYRFAFGPDAAKLQMAPPPHSLLLPDMSQEISLQFLRAFSRGSEANNARPSARDWANSLERFEKQLRACALDPGHFYFNQLTECPWCRIERGNGPHYFVSVSISVLTTAPKQIDIGVMWSQITAVPHPRGWHSVVTQVAPIRCTPQPLPEDYKNQQKFMQRMGYLAISSFGLLLLGLVAPPFAIFMLPVCILLVATWFLANSSSPYTVELQKRRQAVAVGERAMAAAEAAVENAVRRFSSDFEQRLRELAIAKDQFSNVHHQEMTEVERLKYQAKERQLEEHLEKFFIKDAKLQGIGIGRMAALESYGVETAADIKEAAVRGIPGFGPKLTRQLLDWRRSLETQFRFDPLRGLPQKDLMQIRNKFLQMRYAVQRQLEAGPAELNRITITAKAEVERAKSTIAALHLEVAQARANLSICGAIS